MNSKILFVFYSKGALEGFDTKCLTPQVLLGVKLD